MNETTALLLLDAYDAALELELLVHKVSFQAYRENRILHLAAENLLFKTGEALSQARKKDESILDEIPSASAVIGIRNFIIHEYRNVDEETIWGTAVSEIPQTRVELAYVLERAGYSVNTR